MKLATRARRDAVTLMSRRTLSACGACTRIIACIADFDARRIGQYEPYRRRCMGTAALATRFIAAWRGIFGTFWVSMISERSASFFIGFRLQLDKKQRLGELRIISGKYCLSLSMNRRIISGFRSIAPLMTRVIRRSYSTR